MNLQTKITSSEDKSIDWIYSSMFDEYTVVTIKYSDYPEICSLIEFSSYCVPFLLLDNTETIPVKLRLHTQKSKCLHCNKPSVYRISAVQNSIKKVLSSDTTSIYNIYNSFEDLLIPFCSDCKVVLEQFIIDSAQENSEYLLSETI